MVSFWGYIPFSGTACMGLYQILEHHHALQSLVFLTNMFVNWEIIHFENKHNEQDTSLQVTRPLQRAMYWMIPYGCNILIDRVLFETFWNVCSWIFSFAIKTWIEKNYAKNITIVCPTFLVSASTLNDVDPQWTRLIFLSFKTNKTDFFWSPHVFLGFKTYKWWFLSGQTRFESWISSNFKQCLVFGSPGWPMIPPNVIYVIYLDVTLQKFTNRKNQHMWGSL